MIRAAMLAFFIMNLSLFIHFKMVTEEQGDYNVLGSADNQGESTEFVEFMLSMIHKALKDISETQNKDNVVKNVVKNVVTKEDKVLSLFKARWKTFC